MVDLLSLHHWADGMAVIKGYDDVALLLDGTLIAESLQLPKR